MRTIGRKVPADLPHGDFVSMCDYCGTPFYRSQLRTDGAGLLYCELEGDGPDRVTQLEGNAEKAARWAGKQADLAAPVYDGAPFVFETDDPPEDGDDVFEVP